MILEDTFPVVITTIAAATDLLIEKSASGQIPGSILDSNDLRLWIIIGANLGGYLGTALFAKESDTKKVNVLKFSSCAISSFIFTPAIMLYYKVPIIPEWILACSGIVAIVGVGAIKGIALAWTKWVINKFSPPSQ